MNAPTRTCYTIRYRGDNKKPFWRAIGSAWINKDGSFNLKLDALPLDGQITARPRPKDEPETESDLG